MFMFHVAFSLGLIALTAGTALFIWSKHVDAAGSGLAKVIGTLVIIFAIGSTLCTIYYGVKYWQQGDFQSPVGMMHGIMDGNGMPGGMMDSSKMNNSDQSKNHVSDHSQ